MGKKITRKTLKDMDVPKVYTSEPKEQHYQTVIEEEEETYPFLVFWANTLLTSVISVICLFNFIALRNLDKKLDNHRQAIVSLGQNLVIVHQKAISKKTLFPTTTTTTQRGLSFDFNDL